MPKAERFSLGIQNMVAVDLTTGDREMISSPGSLGTGAMYRNVQSITVDAAHHRVFVLGSGDGINALLNVSMETGDRVLLSN